MEFIKYQRDEWELQKLRINKIVGHCDAAEPEQYVNTLLTMLEERNARTEKNLTVILKKHAGGILHKGTIEKILREFYGAN